MFVNYTKATIIHSNNATTYSKNERERERERERQTDRQTDRQTVKQTDRQTDRDKDKEHFDQVHENSCNYLLCCNSQNTCFAFNSTW